MATRSLVFVCVLAAAFGSSAWAQSNSNRPVITSPASALGTVGLPFTYQITASRSPTNFTASNLPAGLLMSNGALTGAVWSNTNGWIVGLPQTAGSTTLPITAANSNGPTTNNLLVTVNPPAPPTLASPATVFGVQGQVLSYPLLTTPSHSNVPTTFSVSGLPPGSTLISNVTTNTAYTNVLVTNYSIDSPLLLGSGSYVVPVVASNAGGVSTNTVTFIINPPGPPVFTSATNANATVGVPFSFDVTAINSPLRFRVTSINSVPVNVTNGVLTNGLSFSNVTVGSTKVGRVFGSPGATNEIELVLQAANDSGITSTNLTITVANSKPTIVLSQPLGEANFVAGSSFFVNAQVFDQLPDVISPSSISFTATNSVITNNPTGPVGRLGDFYGQLFDPSGFPPSAANTPASTNSRFDLQATGRNILGTNASSVPLGMIVAPPQNPLPTISMLPTNPGPAIQAGGSVILRAQASIPSTRVNIDRVEFYVNNVYVGFANAPVAGTTDEYNFTWLTPSAAGSFQISARAVSLNYTTPGLGPPFGLPGQTQFWASVITRTPVIVNTLPGTAPSVAITSPANNGTLTVGVPNRIAATAVLSGGAVESVEFFANGRRISQLPDTQVPFEVEFVPGSVGTYEIFAIATGSNGLKTVSPVVLAEVAGGFVPTVEITSPTAELEYPLGQPVFVEYTSDDSDGYVSKVELLANGAVVDGRSSAGSADGAGLIGTGSFPYTPPSQGVYNFQVRVTDNQGNSGVSQSVRINVRSGATNPLPTVVLAQGPIAEGLYTLGSQLFLNASVTPKGGRTIPADGVKFFANGNLIAATNSGVPPRPGIFGALYEPVSLGRVSLQATARDSATNTGVSGLTDITVYLPTRPFPTVEMRTLNPGTVPAAGGLVTLQAAAFFPTGLSTNSAGTQRVEFYANGAFVGIGTNIQTSGTNAPADPNVYRFDWRLPSAAAALTNSYTVTARAVTIDRTLAATNTNNIFVIYSSAVSSDLITFSPGAAATPVVSIKSPVNGSKVPVGTNVTLLATASIPGSSIKQVTYFANGEEIGFSTNAATSYSVVWTPLSKGTNTLIAVAESIKGFKGNSIPVIVEIPLADDPTIKFLSPDTNKPVIFPPATTFTAAAEVTINTNTRAPIRDVRFFLNEVQQGEPDTTAPYSAQVTLQGVGNYFLKAVATDIYGSTAAVQQELVCANPDPDSGGPPIITMTHPTPGGGGDTQNDFSTPSQFFFNAQVTLPGGVTVAPGGVKFFANGVPVNGTVNNIGNTYSVFWQPDRNADYFITAQVTDSRGITGVSEPLEFIIAPVVRPLPTIQLLPLSSPSATVGSRVFLQAVSNGSITPVARIDFYANGILIGSRDVNDPADGSDTTTLFEWTPTVADNYQITARAIQVLGEVGDNSIISAPRSLSVGGSSGNTPVVNLLQQPISESIYVHGSQLFLNATAVPRGAATMPNDGVTIYYAGEVLPAAKSGVLLGTSQVYTAKADVYDGLSNITVFATARDSLNAIGSSAAATLTAVRPLFPLPTVEMLPLLGSGPFSASEELTLRARAVFPATANTDARVEFYANGAYLGVGTADPNNPTIYTFLWETPPTSGVYKIEARALALNFETNTDNDNKIRHFGSVISFNSVSAEVEAIPGGLIPGSNEAFVVEMYQDLLYRDPSYEEWFVAKEALNASVIDRAAFVMNLMGFDAQRRLFSRVSEFGRTSMTAMLPFYRLGIAPTANQVATFLNLLEADNTPLPITGVYSGIPDAPWGATYGMASAMREALLRSPQFLFAYPTVTSMPNVTFNEWLRNTMFAGVSGGDENLIINMMNTIEPQTIKQGAATAFRSELAWVALEAGYITAPEQTVQLQAATTILQFQLGGGWDAAFGKKNPYSKNVVQQLLASYATSTPGGGGSAAAAPRGPARSYQGLVGGESASAASLMSSAAEATETATRVQGELRVTTSTSGTYSAVLTLDNGNIVRAKGILKSDGSIQDTWPGGYGVNLVPVEEESSKHLEGIVSAGPGASMGVLAGRNVFSKNAPFKSSGNYTLSLRVNPAPADQDSLQGSGYATVKIPASGVAKLAGRLADNTPFTASVPVWGATGQPGEEGLLLHRVLGQGAGSLGGEIYRRNGGVGVGTLAWQSVPSAYGPRRELSLDATLSPYGAVLPETGTVLPSGWKWNAPFSLRWSGGGETGAVGFTLPGTLFGSASGLSLKINTSSGLVGGTLVDPATGAKWKIGGVLDQATKAVDGFFLTPNSSGRLEINR